MRSAHGRFTALWLPPCFEQQDERVGLQADAEVKPRNR
jgi:hypothetical protein